MIYLKGDLTNSEDEGKNPIPLRYSREVNSIDDDTDNIY